MLLVAHVAFLGILRLRKILIKILDVDEWSCEVVACADASELMRREGIILNF